MSSDLNFSLYLNVLFFVILGIALLFGFIRGYKKSTYNLVAMILFYVFFFLTINIIVNFLWDIPLPGLDYLSQIDQSMSGANTLHEAVTKLMEVSLGGELGSISNNEEFKLFVSGFSILIVKLIYTIIYFTILQFLFKIFALIIRVIFFRTKKEDKNLPKRRLLGAGVGFVSGALHVFVILIILGGLMSMVGSTLKFMPKDPELEQVHEMVDSYNQNWIVRMVENGQSKVNPINLKIYDYAYSFTYHNKKISIRKELVIAEEIYDVFLESDYKNTQNISDIKGDEVRDAFNMLAVSDLFPAVIPLGIEMASDYFAIEMPMTKEELYAVNWDQEAKQLGEVAAVTFDLLNTAGLIGDNEVNLETVTFEGDDFRTLFDSLSESNLATLGAYVALEPILKSASGNLQAIITVPEDINFEEEFKAIGVVAGAIADTNVTIGDFKSGNPSHLLITLSDLDFTIIYNSKIISHALINMISGKSNIAELNVFEVPEQTVWFDVYDSQGNIIQTGELKNVLLAFNEMVEVSSDIDFTNLNLNVISNFTDETINTLFESKVMVATISQLIVEMDLGNTPLVMPNSVFDENHYMMKEELIALAKSAKLVFTTLSCDEGTTCDETGFELSKAFNMTDEQIDTLVSSEVVVATVGDIIIDQGGDTITIPNSSLTKITVNDQIKYIITQEEIRNLFKALSTLGFNDLENMTFNASIIHQLATDLDPKVLDQTKVNTILESNIVHATFSTMLLDSVKNSELIVPYQTVNQEVVRYVEFADEYISRTELIAMIKAVLVLNIDDFSDVESLHLDNLIANMDTLLSSAIIHATLSDQLVSLGSNVVTIPYMDENEEVIRQIVGEVGRRTFYINKTELSHLFNALDLLGMTDINSFKGTIELSNFYESDNRNILLKSSIMHATISDQLFDLGSQNLVIPEKSIDGELIKFTVGTIGQETNYVDKDEIHAIIESLEVLNIQDIKTYSGTFNLNQLNDDTKQTNLLGSAAIHATISKKLFDLEDSVLIVPVSSQLDDPIQKTEGLTSFIVKGEIKSIINALLAMQYTNLDSFGTSIDSSKFFSQKEVLLMSSSIQATLSHKMINETNGKLIIPNTVRIEKDQVTYIEMNEMNALIDALDSDSLNLTNFNAINFNPTNVFTVNFDDLLASQSLQATISDTILASALDDTASVGTNGLLVPNYFRQNILVGTNTEEQIEKVELKSLLTALQTLGVTDFNGNMNASTITAMNDTNLSIMLTSGSVHATLHNMLKGNTNISNQIPQLAQVDAYNMDDLTTKTELIAFIKATNVIATGDFTTITFDINTVSNLTEADRNIVLDSMIVRNSLTSKLNVIINQDPTYSVDHTYYENEDISTFFTKQGILDILTHYNYI